MAYPTSPVDSQGATSKNIVSKAPSWLTHTTKQPLLTVFHNTAAMISLTERSAPLTPEQLANLPHDNQGRLLVASIWTLGLIATVFLALRIYCRVIRAKRIGWDDAILIASWVSATPPAMSAIQGC